MKRATIFAMTGITLAMTSACAQRQPPLATTASYSSRCVDDGPIGFEVPAPKAGGGLMPDMANVWDSLTTIAKIMEHDAAHRAACGD